MWIGLVSLRSDAWNRERIDQGVARHLLHHDYALPVGEIREAWFEEGSPGRYKAKSAVPLFPAEERVEYIAEYLRLLEHTTLMDSTSVGFSIDRLVLEEIGETWREDKFGAAWTMYEYSSVSTPAGRDGWSGAQRGHGDQGAAGARRVQGPDPRRSRIRLGPRMRSSSRPAGRPTSSGASGESRECWLANPAPTSAFPAPISSADHPP